MDTKEITLSTGVVLRIKAVATMTMQNVKTNFDKTRPKVPTKFLEEDNRSIEVPEDPEYHKALDSWGELRTEAMLNVALLRGTEIISIPDGFPKPEDEDWLEDLILCNFSFERPTSARARYLSWIRNVAAPLPADLTAVQNTILSLIGVTEEEVAAAAASFRDRA